MNPVAAGNTSLIPYQIIRHIADNNLKEAIEASIELLSGEADDADERKWLCGSEMLRNCVNTAYMISVIFTGINETKKMRAYNKTYSNFHIVIKLPSGKTWGYNICGLFDGNISQAISNDSEFDSMDNKRQLQRAGEYKSKFVSQFLLRAQHLINTLRIKACRTDEIAVARIKRKFLNLRYQVNKTTIDSLREDIAERNAKVTDTRSYIYILRAVLTPERLVEHMSVLEQFYSKSSQKVCFRLYQSWIEKATLADDFSKRSYGPNAEKCWQTAELDAFLKNLDDYYCGNLEQTSPKCYGYSALDHPVLAFDGTSFTGKIFHYKIYEVRPEACLINFAHLLNKRAGALPAPHSG